MQGADAVTHRDAGVALCVGAESMSRNPLALYTHRDGARMGSVAFKDFLWESLLDPAPGRTMGQTAEALARALPDHTGRGGRVRGTQFRSRAGGTGVSGRRNCSGGERDVPARGVCRSRHRVAAQVRASGARYTCAAVIGGGVGRAASRLRRRADRRQQLRHRRWCGGGAGVLGVYARDHRATPLARLVAGVAVGCPPEVMGIGPVPAICAFWNESGYDWMRLTGSRSTRRSARR